MWLHEGAAPAHPAERRLPNAQMDLIVNLRGDPVRLRDPKQGEWDECIRGPVLSGAQSRFIVLDTASQSSMMGVSFKAGGAFAFVREPASEFSDCYLPLEETWGAGAADLHERLLESSTPAKRFQTVEAFLLARLAAARARHPAVTIALRELTRASGPPAISELVRRAGVSPRRLIELFRKEVGLPPKLVSRIQRFQRALQTLDERRHVDWARLALDCGYYDQSHLVRDFHDFVGLSPTVYLAQRGNHPNHVPFSAGEVKNIQDAPADCRQNGRRTSIVER